MSDKSNIFLIAGRTGGPFFPLPTIAKNLNDYTPIYVGVKGGFEQITLQKTTTKLEFLPDIRLTILTFKKERLSETIANYFKFLLSILKFIFAVLKSLFLVLKYRPKLIFTTGSFLAIPIILIIRLTNFLRITKAKIVVHQQDPEPGLSNKFAVKFSHKTSCVFEYTTKNYPDFKTAEIIPNPIDLNLYNFDTETEFEGKLLNNFFNSKAKKPVLLIFGGGSGSEDINVWTIKNIKQLLQNFRIIHLTGILQTKKLEQIDSPDYLSLEIVTTEMKLLLFKVDLVLCRAGLGSITELLLLKKPAFIVPLPHTHQELNAELSSKYFQVLHQKDRPTWLAQILKTYPDKFTKIKFPNPELTKQKLENYFKEIKALLDN